MSKMSNFNVLPKTVGQSSKHQQYAFESKVNHLFIVLTFCDLMKTAYTE